MQKEEKQNLQTGKNIAVLKTDWRRRLYRPLRRIKVILGQLFYELGTQAEYLAVRFIRQFVRLAKFIGRQAAGSLHRQAQAVGAVALQVWQDVTAPFSRAKSGFKNIWALVHQEKQQGRAHAAKSALAYFKSGIHEYGYLAKRLVQYLLPIAAGAVFVVTVVQVMGAGYALAVEYDGNLVGYVENAAVYEDAEKMVEDRIVYTGSEEKSWSMHPTFTVVAAQQDVSNTQQLADAILESCGEEIVEAVGLYVDGVFYGATTDSLQLESDLEEIKRPYEEQYPDAEVSFVQDVELLEGVYLTGSVKSYEELSSLLTSEVQGQRTYVIEAGDTPLIIAGKNDITLAELYALNPVLENGNNVPIGQELTISGAQSFLQVQYSITLVENEEVPYTTNKTNDDNLTYGVQKTTQKGVNGIDEVTYSYTYVDGVLQGRTELSRVRTLEPVTEEISVGTYVASEGANYMPGSGALLFPIDGSGYKGMSRGFTGVYAHNGLDLRGYVGTPIYAAQSGVVTLARYTSTGYGIYCMINHGGGMSTLYGHCSGLAVSSGQYVQQGQLIAYVGSTGNSTGPHCHFEVIINGTRVDPAPYLGW